MAQSYDLWTLLRTYSVKNNTPYVDLKIFIKFLSHNSSRGGSVSYQLLEWAGNTAEKVKDKLKLLLQEGKCTVFNDPGGVQRVFIPYFFVDKLSQIYQVIDGVGTVPFPDEKSMHTSIPKEQCKTISVETGLINYLNDPQHEMLPIIHLTFEKGFGDTFALSSHLPRRIVEMSFLKIKEAFRKNNMMEFYKQRAITHFPGQEARVKEFVNILMLRPMDCIDSLEESNEFSFSFWLFLCPLIKMQVRDALARSSELSYADQALFQAVSFILVFNNFYKIKAINQHEKDLAFAEVESKLTEPPYYFTLGEVLQFKGKNGINILEKYSEDDFQFFIRKRMAVTDEGMLPEILKYSNTEDLEWLVLKSKLWLLIGSLIKESAPKIKDDIKSRWTKMLSSYKRERAMDRNDDFEALINRLARLYCPVLITILHDKKSAVIQEELNLKKSPNEKIEKYFEMYQPFPLHKLLELDKQEILTDCKFSLPFWYSISFLVLVISFFKNGLSKKYLDDSPKNKAGKNKKANETVAVNTLSAQAKKIAEELVPQGTALDDYLLTVLDKWNQLLNKNSRDVLTKDINATIQDYMRHISKIQKRSNINEETLLDCAENIIAMNAALSKINNKDALKLYIKLFITKMLINEKI
ncbi:MAG: hypothetical protein LBV52_04040 [Spirochaetaceae bacterium]|jgi:hypothetical protein|nr:hypothetical protein [Spirochaetaceae bacterium]